MDAPRRVAKRLFPKRLHPRLLNLYLTVLAPLYAGDGVHCPCCEHSFRRFVPYSIGRDVDLICPGCDSVHNLFGRDNQEGVLCGHAELRYDRKADALDISVGEGIVARTVEIDPGTLVNLDRVAD